MSSARIRSSSEINSPDELRVYLSNWPAIQSQLNLIIIGLRRRQLVGSRPCSKATLEILRSVVRKHVFNFHLNRHDIVIHLKLLNSFPKLAARVAGHLQVPNNVSHDERRKVRFTVLSHVVSILS